MNGWESVSKCTAIPGWGRRGRGTLVYPFNRACMVVEYKMMKGDKINHVRHSHLGEEGRRGCINIKSFSFSHLLPMSTAKNKQMKKRTWHSELATGDAKLTPRSRTYSDFVPGSLLVLLLEPCGSKITADGDCSYEIKTLAPWKKSYDQPRQHIKKQRYYFANKGLSNQIIIFSFFGFFFWCGPFLKSLLNLLHYCFCFMFWVSGHVASGILVPQPAMEPISPALAVWSLNHWTARKFPITTIINS